MIRESYINTSSYSSDVEALQKDIERFRKVKPEALDLAETVLLVLDMQDYFLKQESHAYVPSSESILPGIKKLIASFQSKNLKVLFTRHINTSDNARNMASWWKEVITADNPLSNISNNFDLDQVPVIVKPQYDAFFDSGLSRQLQLWGCKNLIITGVMTHLCCETTARSAFVRGYNVIFPIDGTATFNRELHLSSLRSLAHGFACLCTLEQLNAMVKTYE